MKKGITESTIEEIKARIDLTDLISSYGIQVRVAGASRKACCPFHHEKTPSFHINETKGFYHCFGCGESGDAIKFVQKMDGLTFVEAVKKLAEQYGVKIEEKEDPTASKRKRLLSLMAELAQFYQRCLQKSKEGDLAREYLRKRELDESVQADYLIGYAPSGVVNVLRWAEKYKYTPEELEEAGVIKASTGQGDLGYHRFAGRLVFSIKDKQGRVVGFSGRQLVEVKNSGKYVNSPETLVFKKSNILYGFDRAAGAVTKTPNREVIVCEGQIDCIRLQICGFANAVAGQGTAFTEAHVKMLKKVADQVALVYDDDGAGHKATVKSARLCLAAELPVRVVSLPGGNDPDSFLRTHPAEEFRKMLENAESIMAFQVRTDRAKEPNPNSIDAMNRIVKSVLLTISQCPNAVLRAGMVAEAAKLVGVPVAALDEELGKLKTEKIERTGKTDPSEVDGEDGESESVEPEVGEKSGEDAVTVIPPPPKELALCAFLIANEYDKALDGVLGEFLPARVFKHDFTRRFVETWRAEIAQGEDLLQVFASGLGGREREWFDSVLLNGGKTDSSGLSNEDILQDFVRSLWADELRRERGNLPASGDPEVVQQRMKISMDLKRLVLVKWDSVKEMIRDWTVV